MLGKSSWAIALALASLTTILQSSPSIASIHVPVVTETNCAVAAGNTQIRADLGAENFNLRATKGESARSNCGLNNPSPGVHEETAEERYARTCGSRCGDLYVATVIRAADFASFRPRQPLARSEPTSWAPVGLPANFYAEIEPHTIEGTLLGKPAAARFTPASYRWDFGDGSTRTVRSKGAPWKAQSLNEFSDTATSHTFDRSGDYYVTLTVNYSIEYYYEEDADDGWEEFIGYLPIASAPIAMHVAAVKTVLVSKTCLENPNGPGC